tara:strand:+ start:163 stop:633 length:471 start_codon:yes stop_codon:yes gene_type:complete
MAGNTDNKVFNAVNDSSNNLDLFKERQYEMREKPTPPMSNEEISNLVMGMYNPSRKVGVVKNLFKLGNKGYLKAVSYMRRISKLPKKQNNKELYDKAANSIKKELNTEKSLTNIHDMTYKRIALEKKLNKFEKWGFDNKYKEEYIKKQFYKYEPGE